MYQLEFELYTKKLKEINNKLKNNYYDKKLFLTLNNILDIINDDFINIYKIKLIKSIINNYLINMQQDIINDIIYNNKLLSEEKKEKINIIYDTEIENLITINIIIKKIKTILNNTLLIADEIIKIIENEITNYNYKPKIISSSNQINIIPSPGDGSCLLHSINTLLNLNNKEIFTTDQNIWRSNLIQYINKYIYRNLTNLNTESQNILRENLLQELSYLKTNTGWLSYTTIMIICTMLNIKINIITNNNLEIHVVSGLPDNPPNINPEHLVGGLIFNGCHWDCYTN